MQVSRKAQLADFQKHKQHSKLRATFGRRWVCFWSLNHLLTCDL